MNGEMIEATTSKPEKRLRRFVQFGKRNLIVVLSVLLIGGAVALNWILFVKDTPQPGTDIPGGVDVNPNPEDLTPAVQTPEDYFTSAVIDRQRARDQAMETLQQLLENEDALEESKVKASDDLRKIADNIGKETRIETIVEAKGFEECIAVLGENTATIIVKTENLLPNQNTQICEIVCEETKLPISEIRIIPKK